MQCVAMDVTCQTAAECPAGWTCQAENVATSAAACAPGQTCPMLPAPPPPVSKCVPPYYGAQSAGALEVPSTPTSGTGTGTTGTGKGTVTGTAGTSGTGTPNGGTPAPGSTSSSESHDVAACAMGRAPASSGAFALLAMLGALFGLKRRRS
jgi:MYXO-CTERM domain-containing protein